jgi:hypothetical protein
MRGLLRPLLLEQRRAAASMSSLSNQRLRFLDCAGGKRPGWGKLLSEQMNVFGKRQLAVPQLVRLGCFVHQPAYRIVGQHPAVELLSNAIGCFAPEHSSALAQVGFELIKHPLNLPALVVGLGQL